MQRAEKAQREMELHIKIEKSIDELELNNEWMDVDKL